MKANKILTDESGRIPGSQVLVIPILFVFVVLLLPPLIDYLHSIPLPTGIQFTVRGVPPGIGESLFGKIMVGLAGLLLLIAIWPIWPKERWQL